VFDALEPLRTGAGKHLAADLYRQSVFWSLSALEGENTNLELVESLWGRSKSIQGLKLPLEPGARDEVDSLMRRGDFRALAELSEVDRHRVAGSFRVLAHSALELSEPVDRLVRKLLFQRFTRLVGFLSLAALLALLVTLGVHYSTKTPDLALGRPWRTSSVWSGCGSGFAGCEALGSNMFFHTEEEVGPWVEFDLGSATRVSEVYVKNRVDSVWDRAAPLVIEVSDDAETWREVARQPESFRSWTASFEPVAPRYVRLRVDRRSYLHLARVEIHP
jgi:hypothetical protein